MTFTYSMPAFGADRAKRLVATQEAVLTVRSLDTNPLLAEAATPLFLHARQRRGVMRPHCMGKWRSWGGPAALSWQQHTMLNSGAGRAPEACPCSGGTGAGHRRRGRKGGSVPGCGPYRPLPGPLCPVEEVA